MQGNEAEKAMKRGNLNSRLLGPKPRGRKGWANPERAEKGLLDSERQGALMTLKRMVLEMDGDKGVSARKNDRRETGDKGGPFSCGLLL